MEEESENLLEHNFHDSFLIGAEREDRDITLVIDTDIYWFPGRPITLLKLVNADNISKLQQAASNQKAKNLSITEARMVKDDNNTFNYKLDIKFSPKHILECRCYNFWTERKEKYKDYKITTHS